MTTRLTLLAQGGPVIRALAARAPILWKVAQLTGSGVQEAVNLINALSR